MFSTVFTSISGFIADRFGSYIPSFYIVGGIVIFASILPFLLLCPKLKERIGQENVDVDQDDIIIIIIYFLKTHYHLSLNAFYNEMNYKIKLFNKNNYANKSLIYINNLLKN